MWRKAIVSLFAGTFFYLIGSVFAVPAKHFVIGSEPAQLIVLNVEERFEHDGQRMYRPVFGLVTEDKPRPQYVGSIWVSPKPHQTGDVVEGRYHLETGEMRSNRMAERTLFMGRTAQILGLLLALQGLLMFVGFPEIIPVRIRYRRFR